MESGMKFFELYTLTPPPVFVGVTTLMKIVEVDMNMREVSCEWICDECVQGDNNESEK